LKLITDDDELSQNTEYKSLNNSPKKNIDDYTLMKEKEENLKRVEKIITHYYEDFIEIFYNLNDFKLFLSMVQSFNDKYIYNFNSLKIPDIKEIQITLTSIKYTSIIITGFIFLSKNEKLYQKTCKKFENKLKELILITLNNLSKEISFNSLKILDFLNKQKSEIISSQSLCVSYILKIIIENYCLNRFFKELLNVDKMKTHDLISKINEIILYCHNVCYHYNKDKNDNNKENRLDIKVNINNRENKFENNNRNENHNDNYNEKNKENNYKNNNDYNNKNITICSPYIKNKLTKKFCLVLDLDGTLVERSSLYDFGSYFFVRPGVFNLFKELCEYYEINIFTASEKKFADFVIDKLDKDNKYISNRFYDYHCCESFKRLDKIGRDLKKIVTIDDLEWFASYNKSNLIHISMWFSDIFDDELFYITNKLKLIALRSKYDKDITIGLKEINNNLKSKRVKGIQ